MENIINKSNSVQFDQSKCIGCTKCVKRCAEKAVSHLSMEGVGKNSKMIFDNEKNKCILCGQCTLVCPIKSMVEKEDYREVQNLLKNKNEKVLIVQCAPSVRASINESFNLPYSNSIEKKLYAGFKKLGFDKAFDVNFGADITTQIEARELIERLEKNEHLPMFTSCCPSWVSYVQNYAPFLEVNLTGAFSPHIHSGIAYKTWWAERNHIKRENIIVVSIMPCTSKKYEINLNSAKINNIKAVDYVLTVRELVKLFKEENINLEEVEESDGDMLAEYTGASVIYGSSGGVMESALRSVYKIMTGEDLKSVDLIDVRGDFGGFKEANININNKIIKVAVISGSYNFKQFIESEKYKDYHYIEVMNCLGGCINGGGQPLFPLKMKSEEELINNRKAVLYSIDTNSKKRNALDNDLVNNYISWAETQKDKHKLFHYK